MTVVGQKRRFDPLPMTSGLPPETDIVTGGRHVLRQSGLSPMREVCEGPAVVWSGTARWADTRSGKFEPPAAGLIGP